ncbi:hypothetical protein M378DRAFT_576538 [Amanita muscaria Koide BX008]|uniref:Uncharacterized protein n=1 Tax=Amanita muscaria (strain Koide BX008) TaxID=946122 RepID=A0A0C2W3M9_AMAMK|nr:hypothetical protein M378DRAFT_576538 [Amanita muscaria Koide BX008]
MLRVKMLHMTRVVDVVGYYWRQRRQENAEFAGTLRQTCEERKNAFHILPMAATRASPSSRH